jgi:hypothetical protein
VKTLEEISVHTNNKTTFSQLKLDFEKQFDDFELFWFSKPVQVLRNTSLLVL